MMCLLPTARSGVALVILALFVSMSLAAEPLDLKAELSKLRAVGPRGVGHRDAVAAVKAITAASAESLPQVLGAMDGAGPLGQNWLRGVAEAVAQRAVESGDGLPVKALEAFLADTKHSPRARRLAYELIASVDPGAEVRLIPTLLDDPSVELRRDAVAQLLAAAENVQDKQQSIAQFQKAFRHARDLDQIKAAAEKLKSMEQPVDIARHMGFLQTWKVIGPFDNVNDKGWDFAYSPEIKLDLAAEYDGQKGKVRWIEHTTTDDYGAVDLNKVLGNHKGAIAYAYADFISESALPCELRLACINANKVWLNGELLNANHVYHAGDEIDQYIASGKLQRGKNSILLKICQNEQTEPWAQNWKFQLRVCDAVGTAILSQDRPSAKVAALGR